MRWPISLHRVRCVASVRASLRVYSANANRNQYVMQLTERPSEEAVARALSVPPPPEFHGLGAWVEHIGASREELVSVLVREHLGFSQPIVDTLFQFGAIYTSLVLPELPASMIAKLSAEQVAEMAARRTAAAAAASTQKARQAAPQRLLTDAIVPENSYIRVHLSPKRFPEYYGIDWEARVVAHGPDCVILDKPPSVPVAPTVDNLLETALAGAAAGVGATAPLLITSRLDQATEGLIVLGKTPEFVTRYNSHVVRGLPGQYRKFYRAAVAGPPPPLGTMVHHVRVRCRHTGTPYYTLVLKEGSEGAPKAQRCELRVLATERVALGAEARGRFGPGVEEAWEVFIELITGRTHQIRTQLSAAGCPLLGDALYTPLADATLRRRLEEGDQTLELADAQGRRLLTEADGAIGLQACRLEIAEGREVFGTPGPVAFEAGTPWWRA